MTVNRRFARKQVAGDFWDDFLQIFQLKKNKLGSFDHPNPPPRISTMHLSISLYCFVLALVKEQCRLDMRKYSFSQRVINEWNKLPNDCVNASSVNMFKNRIDRYLIRAGYT